MKDKKEKKLTKKKEKENLDRVIKEAIITVVGKQAGEITNFVDNKKHVNEFLIAKKMDITVNQVRNILYRLSDHGLVSSMRKKDKKKGWYTYFWKIEGLKSLEFLRGILLKRIEQINSQIKSREKKNFYVCERCKIEFNEETALLYDFTCNECGGIFSMKDNSKVLKEFNRNTEKLKKRLEVVEEELEKRKEKVEKKKEREYKKEEKEKAKIKEEKRKIAAKKRAAKKKEKEKLAKKKKVKKKVAKKTKAKKKKIIKKKLSSKKKTTKKKSKKKKTLKKKVARKKVEKKKTTKKRVVRKKSKKKK